eukprot:Lithocolla_globosa_v1_NODE_1836_length_2305_cov_1.876444.p3 type:complete len:126 gc:universal NODE_1836_length_2305_cov_1.876444:2218-1841(-)
MLNQPLAPSKQDQFNLITKLLISERFLCCLGFIHVFGQLFDAVIRLISTSIISFSIFTKREENGVNGHIEHRHKDVSNTIRNDKNGQDRNNPKGRIISIGGNQIVTKCCRPNTNNQFATKQQEIT